MRGCLRENRQGEEGGAGQCGPSEEEKENAVAATTSAMGAVGNVRPPEQQRSLAASLSLPLSLSLSLPLTPPPPPPPAPSAPFSTALTLPSSPQVRAAERAAIAAARAYLESLTGKEIDPFAVAYSLMPHIYTAIYDSHHTFMVL